MKELHLYPEPPSGRVIEIQGGGDDMMGLLLYAPPPPRPDSAYPSTEIRFRHTCVTIPDSEYGHMVKIVAPLLSSHEIVRHDGKLTVRPSILCPDCGLHGFVERESWRSADM